MNSQPIIAVVGATGTQGGGLVRALLADPARRFVARAITRKPDGAAARALSDLGAQIVRGDLDDPLSLHSAFAGAHGAFVVTNYWEHLSPEREYEQAGNAARAACAQGLQHVVWSTLVDTRKRVPLSDPRLPTLHGRYKVPHFDAKGEADALFAGIPTTFLRAAFYWDNLIHFGMAPRRGADGKLNFVLPMGVRKLPGIAAADIGQVAFGIFRRGRSLVGATVGAAGEHLSGEEMARELSKVAGEPVRHVAMPFADYARLGFPGADDLANMFQYKHDFNDEYRADLSVERARELHPGLLDFRQWLARHAQQFRAAA